MLLTRSCLRARTGRTIRFQRYILCCTSMRSTIPAGMRASYARRGKYPNSMRSWKQNWDAISPIFKFSAVVRKVILLCVRSDYR